MKDLINKLFKRNTSLLLAAVILFLLAFLLNRYVVDTTSAHYYDRLIEHDIQKKEKDFLQLSRDTALLTRLINGNYSESFLERYLDKRKGYDFFLLEKRDSSRTPQLLFWNTQVARPPFSTMENSDTSRLVSLSNGIYVYISRMVELENRRRVAVEALIPVMWKYFVAIENLKKEFVADEDAVFSVDITHVTTDLPVKSSFGNTLFYLQKTSSPQPHSSRWSIGLTLIGIFLLFLSIHQVAHQVGERYGVWQGALFLTGILGVIRLFTYDTPGLLDLRQFELFDPAIYSSSFVLSSLGDLLINAVLICWVALFINRRLRGFPFLQNLLPWQKWGSTAGLLTVLVIITFVFADILQSLVADAKISFNVLNFFSLVKNPYSFIGFVIFALLALSYFFFSQILISMVSTIMGNRGYIVFIATSFIGLLMLTFTKNMAVLELNLYVLLWLLLFIWIMQRQVFSGLNFKLNVSEVLFWLFVFSFSISAVIIFENRKIEFEQRKRFAEKLFLQADPSSERILSIALTYLDNDFLAPNFSRFRNKQINNQLKDSIINANFSAYLSKYSTRIFTFDAPSMNPLYNDDAVSFDTLNTIFSIQGKPTTIPDLRYFEKSFDKFSYIFKKDVKDRSGAQVGYFFVLSEPKIYKSDALIPELFRQTKELVPDYSPVYSYAVYDSLRLVSNYNDYPFPTVLLSSQVPKSEFEQRKKDNYDVLWYRHSADKIVMIAKKDNSFVEAITLFAYLFSTFLCLLAFYRFVSLLARSKMRWSVFRQAWQLSIRSQIHSTIIMVSLLSFVVIGVATILFFIDRYRRNNQDRLSHSIQIMVNEAQNKLADHYTFDDRIMLYDTSSYDKLDQLIQEISEIHGMDVNIYDTTGLLRISSHPFVYKRGVLSPRMNPLAYYLLHNERQIQSVTDEKMGKVNYLSIYCPIRNADGEAYAYLNIPSYNTQAELKQEISNFLVTVINLNAFIFLVAGTIALFITNRITSSFTIIGQKMRDINLGKMNLEIEWKRKDEIGELVLEYNKMVKKLDESAEALAKSEREGAWRQMARQVAHEIKNPLTPMKLSIQYLQKAIDNNSTNVKELTGNVARTLVEQIDHLSKIASDFSQFANIGNPRNEVFDLHEVIYSISSLYEATENLEFTWQPISQRVMVFADKTQLNRLFTNLLQNALEASNGNSHHIISIAEQLNGEYITVSITDNGEGIPLLTQSKIFTPNFTTKSSGTGLGLAMSKTIAEQARGDIWFVTKEGEGTTFFVKLPLLRATN